MRKTKIICTLGPASADEKTVEAMLNAGMNIARLNFSHGTHESHRKYIDTFRQVRDKMGLPAAVMLDTKGPEIRVGTFKNKSVKLLPGNTFTLTTSPCEGDANRVFVGYERRPEKLSPGDTVLLCDGLISLTVDKIAGGDIVCIVENGGTLSDHKGVNVPGVALDMEFLSATDKSDLIFGITFKGIADGESVSFDDLKFRETVYDEFLAHTDSESPFFLWKTPEEIARDYSLPTAFRTFQKKISGV